MLEGLLPLDLPADSVLAEDDAQRCLRASDLAPLGAAWRARLPGRRLVVLVCANTVPHLAALAGLRAAGHVVILWPRADASLEALIALYAVEAVVQVDADGACTVRDLGAGRADLHPELALCLSTSGSTGSPKLVRFSEAQLAANARAVATYLALGPREVALGHLPFAHAFGLSVVLSHVASGARVRLTSHSMAQKEFWSALSQATSLAGVPFHFEMLLPLGLARAPLPALRTLTQAGGRLAPAVVRQVHALAEARGWRFHVMYGQTEAGPRVAWLPHERVEAHPDCIGGPIPGVRMALDGGELVVEGPGVMLGYAADRADLALGDTLGGRLRTGDEAEQLAPDLFRVIGRRARFLKLQGNRVGLQEVEDGLREDGFEAACLGRDDLLVVCTTETSIERVRRAALARFSFPARSLEVRHVAALPRRDNGKLDYAALARQHAEEGERP